MRNFGPTEIRATTIPNFKLEQGETIPFRNVDTRVFTEKVIDKDKNEDNDSESENETEKNHEVGEIIGTFINYPETYTLNRLFDQIVDNYSSYPIFGSLSYKNSKNNITGKIQGLATQLLSTTNNNINNNNKKQNDDDNNENFEWLTYGEFSDLVKATATGLIKVGGFSTKIGVDGEFVGILLENSIYFPLAQWACAFIGAVIIPIDISYEPEIVTSMVQVFKCTSIICSKNTFKNLVLKMYPHNSPGKVNKVFVFCDDSDLGEIAVNFQDRINENDDDKDIEEIFSEEIGIKCFSLPQILASQVQEQKPKKNTNIKANAKANSKTSSSKHDIKNEEEDFPDVEIDNDTDYLTNHDVLSRIPQIYPDTLCALNVGAGRCGSLKPCYLTHYNLIAAAAGVESCGYNFGRDIYMSNLPMFRDFERSLQLTIIAHGGCVGFIDNVDELMKIEEEAKNKKEPSSSKSNKIYDKNYIQEEDIEDEKRRKVSEIIFKSINILRPTILALTGDAVKDISDILIQKTLKQNVFKRMIYDFTLKLAEQATDSSSPIPWISKILAIDQFRSYVGGRLRLVISTSCYLNPQIQHNIRILLQIPCIQMYGVTEAGGVCCIQHVDDKDVGNVGAPTATCEIRLRNFFSANTNVNNGDQGEIMVKGPCLFKCYHKNEELTNKSITEDGWFATGDLGKILDNGTVEVIDTINDFNNRRREMFERAGYRY
ncbi:hypothetical protein M9Y10_001693 [Tritrichomonas musculus]|uniref:AMP-dependent synthetase/ligase domain-containing protein n=1 Tax=Tritrichomonas musculus TaxID=1915356 RepID=A0ABR2L7R1_9EUKA